MTIRLFAMGLKCFGRFDFIVLTFTRLRDLRHIALNPDLSGRSMPTTLFYHT